MGRMEDRVVEVYETNETEYNKARISQFPDRNEQTEI